MRGAALGEVARSALLLEAQVGKAPKRARSLSARQVKGAVEAANKMLAAQDWSGAKPSHLVALWAICHEHVHGVSPVEDLQPAVFARACVKAADVLRKSFGGDPAKMAGFMSWAWLREKERGGTRRLGWQLLFSGALVGDWRVATAGRQNV